MTATEMTNEQLNAEKRAARLAGDVPRWNEVTNEILRRDYPDRYSDCAECGKQAKYGQHRRSLTTGKVYCPECRDEADARAVLAGLWTVFIRCGSHRARDRVSGRIGRKPLCHYILPLGSGYVYEISLAELEEIKSQRIPGVTVARVDRDKIGKCWRM
jgi:hypothetical protein